MPDVEIAAFLRELEEYVVLRNEADLFDNLRRGGDVDLLVRDLARAERTLIRHLGPPIRITKRSSVTECFYEWGNIDFLPSIEWRGADYLPVDTVLEERRVSVRGLPVPRLAHEALVSWLTSLLWGGFFKERYATVIRQAVASDGSAFRHALTAAAGRKWGTRLYQAAVDGHPEVSKTWARSLRVAIWTRAWRRSPVRTVARGLAFVVAELRLRFDPPVPWLALLGPAASGTASVLDEMVQRSNTCRFASVRAFTCRPGPLARHCGGPLPTAEDARPSEKPDRSNTSVLLLATDRLLEYWMRLVHLRAKGCILAFDQPALGLVVDRARWGVGSWLARALSRLVPKPDLLFVLESAPATLPPGGPKARAVTHLDQPHELRAGTRQPVRHTLEANLPTSAVVEEMQRVVRTWLLNRTITRLALQTPVSVPPATVTGMSGPSSFSRDRAR